MDRTALIGASIFSALLGIAVYFDFIWFALLPFLILLSWWGIKRLDLFIGTILITVPLSLNLQEFSDTSLGLYMPTEPLLFLGLLIFVFRSLKGWPVDKRLLTHPISIIISLMMLWMLITTVTSFDPIVSLKFTISRAWFIAGFFFFLGHIMLHKPEYRERMVMLMIFPLCIVIVYTLIRHAEFGFEKHAGHWVMKPFFKDHTSYGAVMAMFLPPAIALLSKRSRPTLTKVMLAIATGVIALGLVFSFTRAAWVSLVIVAAIYAANIHVGAHSVKKHAFVQTSYFQLLFVFLCRMSYFWAENVGDGPGCFGGCPGISFENVYEIFEEFFK